MTFMSNVLRGSLLTGYHSQNSNNSVSCPLNGSNLRHASRCSPAPNRNSPPSAIFTHEDFTHHKRKVLFTSSRTWRAGIFKEHLPLECTPIRTTQNPTSRKS